MKLLLDTNAFLWWRENDPKLGLAARRAIMRADEIYVSVVSAWEIAIKIALGRLRLPTSVEQAIDDCGFSKLLIGFEHAERVGALPHYHRDPFDRMLIAQAEMERLTIVTADRQFADYRISIIST